MLTQKLLKEGYAARLKSSLQKLHGGHQNMVDRCEISISQMTMNLLLFAYMFSFLYHCHDFSRKCIYEYHGGCLIGSRNCLQFLVGSVLLTFSVCVMSYYVWLQSEFRVVMSDTTSAYKLYCLIEVASLIVL
jgi:hypothetical protein